MPSPPLLLEALDEAGTFVESAAHRLIFLDFDGTLAPIAERPQLARLPAETRAIVEVLARRADCTVSIVSGRGLEDIHLYWVRLIAFALILAAILDKNRSRKPPTEPSRS